VCDLETSRMGAPYIYDISHLRVNRCTGTFHSACIFDTAGILSINQAVFQPMGFQIVVEVSNKIAILQNASPSSFGIKHPTSMRICFLPIRATDGRRRQRSVPKYQTTRPQFSRRPRHHYFHNSARYGARITTIRTLTTRITITPGHVVTHVISSAIKTRKKLECQSGFV